MLREEQLQWEKQNEDWLRFVDTLNHELKTPLTSIIAAAGLLAEEIGEDGHEPYRRLIQNITHNAETLETRLAELLDSSCLVRVSFC